MVLHNMVYCVNAFHNMTAKYFVKIWNERKKASGCLKLIIS